MAKSKDNVLFPSLMSQLGIGGSTSGLLSDLTGGKAGSLGGVVPSLLNMGQKSEKKDTEVKKFSAKELSDKKKRSDLKIAVDSSDMKRVTAGGYFLDDTGDAYINTPDGFVNDGEYSPDIHGLPVPLGKNKRSGLSIAAFLRPSGSGALTNAEFERALRIINTTSPNEFIRQQRENILIQQSRFGV